MSIRDLVPRRKESEELTRRGNDMSALERFHRDIDRMFADFFGDTGLGLPARWDALDAVADWPRVNVAESAKDVIVTAELPGVDEKKVKVEVDEATITLKGETCEEHEEKDRHWTRVERRCGSFERTIPLPAEVATDRAKAAFKRGVLTVTLPKVESSASRRKAIPIEAG
ncbi:MAG: Hsp20/alpha crystallin family protein [Kiritimatiellae bacterium]|nr:Hsp20/alpha crystallin family protein [Kiritimatiellia bacterium]